MIIEIDRLKRDLKDACYAAYFGGGVGSALMESFEIEKASPEELVRLAKELGLDIRKYVVG